jgi:putative transposase
VTRIHDREFATMAKCEGKVMDWLHFYNSTRLHSTLNSMCQMQFEEQWHLARPQRAAQPAQLRDAEFKGKVYVR